MRDAWRLTNRCTGRSSSVSTINGDDSFLSRRSLSLKFARYTDCGNFDKCAAICLPSVAFWLGRFLFCPCFVLFLFFLFFPGSPFLQSSFSIPSLFSYFLSFVLFSSFCLPILPSRFLFLFSYLPFLISFSVFFFTSSFPHPILLRPSPFQTSSIPLTFLSLGPFLPYSRLLFLLLSPFPSSSSVLFSSLYFFFKPHLDYSPTFSCFLSVLLSTPLLFLPL